MKLTEQDLRDACEYIMDQVCVSSFGENYIEKEIHFDIKKSPVTVRMIVDFFIEWLKIRHAKEKRM